jgi:hypothetical protein
MRRRRPRWPGRLLRRTDGALSSRRACLLAPFGARLEILAGNPRVVKLTGPPDGSSRARTARVATGAVHTDADDPSAVLLDLDVGGATLTMPDGAGVVLAARPDGPAARAGARRSSPGAARARTPGWCARSIPQC